MDRERKTVFDSFIDKNKIENIFTKLSNLTNEASVEKFFLDRLIDDLRYKDENIKVKESIEKLQLSKGAKKYNYKPDYVLTINNIPRLVVDAKSPEEDIEEWVEQCVSYSTALNRRAEKQNIKYFLLSNGINTNLYSLDRSTPLLKLKFEDFFEGSVKYAKLHEYISKTKLKESSHKVQNVHDLVTLYKIDKEDAQKLFVSCHNKIWKADKMNPQSAFMEFTKLICLKLYHDRCLHEGDEQLDSSENLVVPKHAVTFSTWWITSRKNDAKNPISDIQYKNLLELIDEDIAKQNKKRMFSTDDVIDLKPDTIKTIVGKLEKYDLYGIDDDLNGRLFETFLNATMRGKELGQYFTPRSIVKLAVKLSQIKVSENHIDVVLDACCGTGGFLIEAFANMKNTVNNNDTYSKKTKDDLIEKITQDSIFGIDAAKNPMLSRIARINMYLHGDGGSHIYFADSLDKKLPINETYNLETRRDIEDLKSNIETRNGFDVVLTNPPFSMSYSKSEDGEREILYQYDLAKKKPINKILRTNTRDSLISGIMFIERYHELLADNGKILSVIDESVLSGSVYKFVREFIRKRFIVRAIISLHGDAFQMSKSRVKTSLLYLEKKKEEDTQPNIFMYMSTKLGVDDMPVTTPKEKIRIARKKAEEEIGLIITEFEKYQKGEKTNFSVTPDKIHDRLDVKHCLGLQGRFVEKWEKESDYVLPLEKILCVQEKFFKPVDFPTKKFKILKVLYNGHCKFEMTVIGKNAKMDELQYVKKGDLIISKYNAFNGSVAIVNEEFDGYCISESFILLEPKNESLPEELKQIQKEKIIAYLWAILRTSEMGGEFLSCTTGMGRQTMEWLEGNKGVSKIMIPIKTKIIDTIYQNLNDVWEMESEIQKNLTTVHDMLNSSFGIESEESINRLEATKPPR